MREHVSEKGQRPFLLRLAQSQQVAAGLPSRYDQERDELLVLVDGEWVPAIESPRGGPETKKADIETNEDQKDRW